jgi:MFS family permease
MDGSLYFLPLNLIQVQDYTAVEVGAALLPFILTMFLLSHWAGALVDRYGAKKPLMIGPAIAALGFSLFALPATGGSYELTFFPAVMVLGLGMAISVSLLTTTVMNTISRYRSALCNCRSSVDGGIYAADHSLPRRDSSLPVRFYSYSAFSFCCLIRITSYTFDQIFEY